MIILVHLSWDQCHFIQGRLRSWLQGRQAGWFRRWIAVCEGGTVGAAVGFAVGTAECEGIRLYTGVRTRLATKIVPVTHIWDEYCWLLSNIDILFKKYEMDLTCFIKADLVAEFKFCKMTFSVPQYCWNCLLRCNFNSNRTYELYCLGILLLRMKWIFFCIEERSWSYHAE